MPKITITKVKRAIPVESGNSLASIIKQLTDMGVTDFSKVHFESNYVSCAADHGDGYCYCNPSYDELRFEFMQDTSNTEKQVVETREPSTDDTLRLYAIVRTDLGMKAGKIASQAGHAYLGAWEQATEDRKKEYHQDGIGTKVCLECPDEHTMQRLHEEAQAMGLPCFYVIDSGCPNFFNGAPTATALGIGPMKRAQSRFLRKLKLMN